jgi:hypothetical protein
LSFEAIASNIINNKVNEKNGASVETLTSALNTLNQSVELQSKISEIPYVFLRSNGQRISTTGTAGDLLITGNPVPPGFRGTVEDFNVTFGTSGGTVELVILDQNNNLINFLVMSITANQNGTGATVLEEGQRLGIRLNTSGAGIIGTFCSGKIKRTNVIVPTIAEAELRQIGG